MKSERNRIGRSTIFAAALSVIAPMATAAIDVNKSFSPATAYPTQVSRVTLSLQNSDLTPASDASFIDDLPSGMFLAANPNMVNNCGGLISSSNGPSNGNVALSGGVIPAGDGNTPGSCTISFDIIADSSGTFLNEILTGGLTAEVGGFAVASETPARASLTVVLENLEVTVATDIGTTLQGFERSIQRVQITNPNPIELDGASFSFDMQQNARNIRAVTGLPFGSTCGGTVSFTPQTAFSSDFGATTEVNFSGGVIPAGATCEVFYAVEASRDPTRSYSSVTVGGTLPIGSVTTNLGAINVDAAIDRMRTALGIRVIKQFDRQRNSSININDTMTSVIRLRVLNYNIVPVVDFNLTDILPAGMTLDSINSNNCGTIPASTTEITIQNGNLNAAPDQQSGSQSRVCAIEATVSISASGTYENTIPAGTIDGNDFTTQTASLIVSGDVLDIGKSFSKGSIFAGDTVNIVFTATNLSMSQVTNLRIPDNLATMGYGFRVGPDGLISNSCGGSTNILPDATQIQTSGMTVAPGAVCEFEIQLISAADTYNNGGGNQRVRNRINSGNILFDINGQTDVSFDQRINESVVVQAPYLMSKSFTPNVVSSGGISRLRVNIQRRSLDRVGMNQILLRDILPTHPTSGQVLVATSPNLLNGCGGTLTATPGTGVVELSNASLVFPAGTATTVSCFFEVDVVAPIISDGSSEQSVINLIPRELRGTPRDQFQATDIRQAGLFGNIHNSVNFSAELTYRPSNIPASIEFLPSLINGGGVSRVRITFSNLNSGAIDLTGLGINIPVGSFGISLYSSVTPTFTDASGNANANGCRGGIFSGAPGGSTFSLTDAEIDTGSTCYLEFNVTAFTGGSKAVDIVSGEIVTNEAVTNQDPFSATLTVGYQIGVGKGFSPPSISVGGTSTLILNIYNTNERPAIPTDTTNDYNGKTPALIDLMPVGVQVITDPVTNCIDATVSRGIDGSGRHFLRVDGGRFEASGICRVTADVTSSALGSYVNRIEIGDLQTLDGGDNPDATEATLRVIKKADILKNFTPETIPSNGVSRILFTLTNPNSSSELPSGFNGVSFTDTLIDMEVSAPLFIDTNCSGLTNNVSPGATNLTFSDIRIPAGSSCDVSIDVTSNIQGSHPNQASGVSTDQYSGPGIASNIVDLIVVLPAVLEKLFDRMTAVTGDITRMTLRITNSNNNPVPLNDPSMVDTFPLGMVVADVPNATTSCSIDIREEGTPRAPEAGSTGIELRGGIVPANSTCLVEIDLTATAEGIYENTITTFSSAGGSSGPTTATVTYTAARPDLNFEKSVRVISENMDGSFICATGVAVVGAQAAIPGACVEYTVTVNNTAISTATGQNLEVSDIFPNDITYQSSENFGFDTLTLDPGNIGIVGRLSLLNINQEVHFTVRATIN